MQFRRYSAVEMFGIPLSLSDVKRGRDSDSFTADIMEANDIEPQPVATGPTDITPYYWHKNQFIYYLSLVHPDGPAVVELLPRNMNSETVAIGKAPTINIAVAGIRRVVIPDDSPTMAIIGGSPRFEGQLCLHEVVTYSETE